MRRRKQLTDNRDTREIVVLNGDEIDCETFGVMASQHMREIDRMPDDWRKLVNEYGEPAQEMFENSVPMFSGQRPVITAADAAKRLAREYGTAI